MPSGLAPSGFVLENTKSQELYPRLVPPRQPVARKLADFPVRVLLTVGSPHSTSKVCLASQVWSPILSWTVTTMVYSLLERSGVRFRLSEPGM